MIPPTGAILGEILPKIPGQCANIRISDLPLVKEHVPKLYGYLLMACIRDQVTVLTNLWGERYRDEVSVVTFAYLCKAGLMPEMMDLGNEMTRKIFEAVRFVVDDAKYGRLGRLDNQNATPNS